MFEKLAVEDARTRAVRSGRSRRSVNKLSEVREGGENRQERKFYGNESEDKREEKSA